MFIAGGPKGRGRARDVAGGEKSAIFVTEAAEVEDYRISTTSVAK